MSSATIKIDKGFQRYSSLPRRIYLRALSRLQPQQRKVLVWYETQAIVEPYRKDGATIEYHIDKPDKEPSASYVRKISSDLRRFVHEELQRVDNKLTERQKRFARILSPEFTQECMDVLFDRFDYEHLHVFTWFVLNDLPDKEIADKLCNGSMKRFHAVVRDIEDMITAVLNESGDDLLETLRTLDYPPEFNTTGDHGEEVTHFEATEETDQFTDRSKTKKGRTYRTITEKQNTARDVAPSRTLNYLTPEQLERNDNLSMGRTYFDRPSSGAARRYGSTFLYDEAMNRVIDAFETGQIDQEVFDALCAELVSVQTKPFSLKSFHGSLVKRFKKPQPEKRHDP